MAESIPLITDKGTRTPCTYCRCGFNKNPFLFPGITREKVRIALKGIDNEEGLNNYLTQLGIKLERNGNDIDFPEGLCYSVRNCIRNRVKELGIEIDEILGFGYSAWNWRESKEEHIEV